MFFSIACINLLSPGAATCVVHVQYQLGTCEKMEVGKDVFEMKHKEHFNYTAWSLRARQMRLHY